MFSLNWFITLPGILITVGVLLLVAALVIFLVTKNKGKKDKNKDDGVSNMANAALTGAAPAATPMMPDQNQAMPTDNAVAGMASSMGFAEQPAMQTGQVGVAPTMDMAPQTEQVEVPNVYSTENPNMVNPTETPAPVAETPAPQEVPQVALPDSIEQTNIEVPNVYSTEVPSVPEVQAQPAVEPVQTPSADIANNVAPNNTTFAVPSTEQVVPEMTQQAVSAPAVNQAEIYGGSTPTVPEFNAQTEPQPQIYGGANPLQNNEQVPIADITNNMAQPSQTGAYGVDNSANVAAVTAPSPDAGVAPVVETPVVASPQQAPAYNAAPPQAEMPQNNVNQ